MNELDCLPLMRSMDLSSTLPHTAVLYRLCALVSTLLDNGMARPMIETETLGMTGITPLALDRGELIIPSSVAKVGLVRGEGGRRPSAVLMAIPNR